MLKVITLNLVGVIRNTEPLDYERSHNHILTVVAYDCGMKQSVPVMVTIKVNRVCKLGWKGKLQAFFVNLKKLSYLNLSLC